MDADNPSSPAADPRVLLVDDDHNLREMLNDALTSAGFAVEQASTGAEAVAAFQRQCPDVLLSDLVIPEPNGQELANLFREACPGALFVFMSGYSEEELHELDITQVVFIPKPIAPKELIRTLNRLLERD